MEFKNIINKIRDIVRKVGITDTDCLNHCVAFTTLRLLTPKMCQKLDVPEKFSFEKFEEDLDDEELRNKFWIGDSRDKNNFCYFLRNNIGFSTFKFKNEINNLMFRDILNLLKKMKVEMLSKSCDIVGIIYELHLGTGGTRARDLGQFFTNRLVIEFMVKLADPKILENGQIETIVDPTMGTGGFLSIAVDYLNKKGKVNWKKNKKRIFGYDIQSHVRDLASLNMLLEVNEKLEHLYTRDTLSKDCCDENDVPIQTDIILANEPMGLKGLKYKDCCERIKDMGINGTKAEPMFVQLFMTMLKKEGRCCVIVPDGFLFSTSKQHSETRKKLLEDFEVVEIIKLADKKMFINTGVSASIIFFKNPEILIRDTIKFSEISLNKDSTQIQYKEIKCVEFDEIVNNNYNLNPSIYTQEKIRGNEGIEMMRLGDICDIEYGTRITKKEVESVNGKYPCYGGGGISFHMDKFNRQGKNLVISRFGMSENCVRILNGKFWLNDSGFTITTKNKNICQEYLNFILKNNSHVIFSCGSGSCQKNIDFEMFNNIEIPVPSLEIQKSLVEKLDVLNDSNKSCELLISQLKKKFHIIIENLTKDCEEIKKIEDVCELNYGSSKKPEEGELYPYMGGGEKPEGSKGVKTMRLGDIFTLGKSGKTNSKDISNTGEYPFYKASCQNPSGTHSTYDFDGVNYLLIVKSGGSSKNPISDTYGIGKVFLVSGKCAANVAVFQLLLKSKDDIKFLYYYLLYNQSMIQKLANYTTNNGNIDMKMLMDLQIPIPSLKKQQEIVDNCSNLMNLITTLEKQIEENNGLMKLILTF